jgi:hypothetical protein
MSHARSSPAKELEVFVQCSATHDADLQRNCGDVMHIRYERICVCLHKSNTGLITLLDSHTITCTLSQSLTLSTFQVLRAGKYSLRLRQAKPRQLHAGY